MSLVAMILDSLLDRETWRLSRLAILRIANGVPRDSQRPTPDPRILAESVGCHAVVASVNPCWGVAVVDRVILFRAHLLQPVWGLRVYHGIAHALLARTTCRYSEADVCRLTAELVAPMKYAASEGGELLELAQSYAPPELVREIVEQVRARKAAREKGSHIRLKKRASEFSQT